MKNIYLALAALSLICAAPAEAKDANQGQNPFFGVWETARVPEEGEVHVAHVKVEACRNNPNKVCGHVIWSEVKVDPESGKSPICSQTLKDFEVGTEPNTYENGELYSSRTGKTYTGHMKLKDPNHLLLTGSVFGGLFSRTTTWTRVGKPGKDPC